jgi:hypothetical protein
MALQSRGRGKRKADACRPAVQASIVGGDDVVSLMEGVEGKTPPALIVAVADTMDALLAASSPMQFVIHVGAAAFSSSSSSLTCHSARAA